MDDDGGHDGFGDLFSKGYVFERRGNCSRGAASGCRSLIKRSGRGGTLPRRGMWAWSGGFSTTRATREVIDNANRWAQLASGIKEGGGSGS
jgi:hypothetical protein